MALSSKSLTADVSGFSVMVSGRGDLRRTQVSLSVSSRVWESLSASTMALKGWKWRIRLNE